VHLEPPFSTLYVRHQKHLALLPLSILDIAHLLPCLFFMFFSTALDRIVGSQSRGFFRSADTEKNERIVGAAARNAAARGGDDPSVERARQRDADLLGSWGCCDVLRRLRLKASQAVRGPPLPPMLPH